jgi:hypothetical protein
MQSDNRIWWGEVNDLPEITEEIEKKLDRTAKLLLEISDMWSIPDLGLSSIEDIPVDHIVIEVPENCTEEEREHLLMKHRAFLFNCYQDNPFVPLFFNEEFYWRIKERIIHYLGVRENAC